SNTIRGGAVSCSGIQDFVISNNIIVGVSALQGYVLRLDGGFGAVTGNNIHGAVLCSGIQDFVISNNIIVGVSAQAGGEALFLNQGGFGAVTGNIIQTGNI